MSFEEFKRLQALDTRKAYYAWELPDEFVKALETAAAPAWTECYNHEIK